MTIPLSFPPLATDLAAGNMSDNHQLIQLVRTKFQATCAAKRFQ